MKQKIVTVFGSGVGEPLDDQCQVAHELGRTIAEAGWILCNGGYGGTMEAAARGAVEAGGHTIGVTCAAFGRSGPNPYVRQEVPTFDLLQRLNTLVRLGRAYVILPGGTGTMLELSLIWELSNKGLLRPRRPIVLLGDHWLPVVECITRADPETIQPLVAADVPGVRRILSEHLNHSGCED